MTGEPTVSRRKTYTKCVSGVGDASQIRLIRQTNWHSRGDERKRSFRDNDSSWRRFFSPFYSRVPRLKYQTLRIDGVERLSCEHLRPRRYRLPNSLKAPVVMNKRLNYANIRKIEKLTIILYCYYGRSHWESGLQNALLKILGLIPRILNSLYRVYSPPFWIEKCR